VQNDQIVVPSGVTSRAGKGIYVDGLASYYFYHDNWRWAIWEILGLSMIAVSVLLAALLLDKGDFPASDDTFTVESETPDHVIHMNGTSASSSAAPLLKSTGDRDVSLL
jgi:hypothetical protein